MGGGKSARARVRVWMPGSRLYVGVAESVAVGFPPCPPGTDADRYRIDCGKASWIMCKAAQHFLVAARGECGSL